MQYALRFTTPFKAFANIILRPQIAIIPISLPTSIKLFSAQARLLKNKYPKPTQEERAIKKIKKEERKAEKKAIRKARRAREKEEAGLHEDAFSHVPSVTNSGVSRTASKALAPKESKDSGGYKDTASRPSRAQQRETASKTSRVEGQKPSTIKTNNFSSATTSERPKKQSWQIQKLALKEKFGEEGWKPRKRLSPDTLDGIRTLHASDSDKFSTPVLAEQFKVSPEVVRRILKSKWQPSDEDQEKRQERWEKRGEKIWATKAELGVRPPKKWREKGVAKAEPGIAPKWKKNAHYRDRRAQMVATRASGAVDLEQEESFSDRIL